MTTRALGATLFLTVEIVELNPLVDPTHQSPLLANRGAREMLTGVAMRKIGITEPDYLAPGTLDHGQSDE